MIILIEIAIRTKDFHAEFQKLSSKLIEILELTTQAAPQKLPRSLTVAAPPQLTPQSTPRDHAGSAYLQSDSTTGQGQRRLGVRIGCEGQRGLHPRLCLSGVMDACIGSALDLCLWLTWTPIASALPHCAAKIMVCIDGNTHTQREQSQLGPTLRTSPTTWDQNLPPLGR